MRFTSSGDMPVVSSGNTSGNTALTGTARSAPAFRPASVSDPAAAASILAAASDSAARAAVEAEAGAESAVTSGRPSWLCLPIALCTDTK